MNKFNLISMALLLLFLLLSCSPKVVPPSQAELDAIHLSQLASSLATDHNGLSEKVAVMDTTKGRILIKFYPQKSPATVARVMTLILSRFYDDNLFHRFISNYVAQTGLGNGTVPAPGLLIHEKNDLHHIKGVLSMVRGETINSASSQFFITLATLPHLDEDYTVFGVIVEGMEIASKLQKDDKIITMTIADSLVAAKALTPLQIPVTAPTVEEKSAAPIEEEKKEIVKKSDAH